MFHVVVSRMADAKSVLAHGNKQRLRVIQENLYKGFVGSVLKPFGFLENSTHFPHSNAM